MIVIIIGEDIAAAVPSMRESIGANINSKITISLTKMRIKTLRSVSVPLPGVSRIPFK